MANEENTAPIPEVAAANPQLETSVVKKSRAPRRQKAAADATTSDSAKSGKLPRTRRKRNEDTGDLEPASAPDKSAPKAAARSAGRVVKATPAPVAALDEMADLLQLEEENKRLRNLLAEKLRGENADLRKRLGLD